VWSHPRIPLGFVEVATCYATVSNASMLASRDVSLFGERAGERPEKRRVAVRALEGRGVREASPFLAEHGDVNVLAGVTGGGLVT